MYRGDSRPSGAGDLRYVRVMGWLEQRVIVGAIALVALGAMVVWYVQPDSAASWLITVGIIVALAGLVGLAIRSDRTWVRSASRWLLGGALAIFLVVMLFLALQGWAMVQGT